MQSPGHLTTTTKGCCLDFIIELIALDSLDCLKTSGSCSTSGILSAILISTLENPGQTVAFSWPHWKYPYSLGATPHSLVFWIIDEWPPFVDFFFIHRSSCVSPDESETCREVSFEHDILCYRPCGKTTITWGHDRVEVAEGAVFDFLT